MANQGWEHNPSPLFVFQYALTALRKVAKLLSNAGLERNDLIVVYGM